MNMLYLITNVNYASLLKKISYFRVGFAIFFIKLEDFNENIKSNPLL